jgi:gamma-glutamyltranspeptidase/glutathione hydrolase
LASGVPGSVEGMVEAHKKYGTLPWKDLVQPAIDLALKGFLLTEREANWFNEMQADLKKYNTSYARISDARFMESRRFY